MREPLDSFAGYAPATGRPGLNPPPVRRRLRRTRVWWAVLIALLLHAAALVAIFRVHTTPLPDLTAPEDHQDVASDDVAMVFETKQKEPPSQKSENSHDKAVADAASAPPPPAPKTPPVEAARPAAPQPTVSLDAVEPIPEPPIPPPDLSVPSASVPVPPPPQAARRPPAPRPAPSRQFAQPRPSTNGFPAPQNFSFGSNPNAVTSRGNTGAVATARPLGGASPQAAGGRDFLLDASLVSGADPGKDWFAELLRWWLAHRHYPEQAAANLEQGDPGLRLTVERDGHVRNVEIYTRSGSVWLDMGAQGTFRDAHLPPFPPQTQGGESVIALNIHYYLIFR